MAASERNDTFPDNSTAVFSVADGLELVFNLSVMTVGPAASILVILVTVRTPNLRTPSNAMVAVQCGTDLLFALCVGPTTAISIITNDWPFNPAICVVSGLLSTVCRMMSPLALTLIAVNRCVVITTDLGDGMFTWRNTAVALGLFMAASVTLVLSCHVQGLEIGYSHISRRCLIVADTNSPGFVVFFWATIALTVSMVIISVPSYVRILLYVRRSGAKLRGQVSDARKRHEFLLTRNCGLLFLVFFVCWLLVYFLLGISAHAQEPLVYTVRFAACLLIVPSIANPVVYGMTSTNYQTAIRDLIGRHCFCKDNREDQFPTFATTRTPEVPVPAVSIHVSGPPGSAVSPVLHGPPTSSALVEETRL
ncbi:allatostatin-A receptor-like [Branchiostoma floridae x Branchiostoma japonicum]